MSTAALTKAVHGETVTAADAAAFLTSFADNETPPELLAALLTAMTIRGETAAALTGFTEVLRDRMTRVKLPMSDALDLCGTGGDGQHTVNVSTAAAFVVAAAGVPVAKHGNHGVSSRTGSVDVLSALGVSYKMPTERLGHMVRDVGVGFLYAPAYHPLFAKIGPVRRHLGFRTAFNLLGPLCNPAGVRRQLIGVASESALHVVADVLCALDTERALVVHTPGPYDEVSLTAPAVAVLVEHGERHPFDCAPDDFGAQQIDANDLTGSDSSGNAARIEAVYAGETGGLTDAICANAACALFVAGQVDGLADGFDLARTTITDGRAAATLAAARAFSTGPHQISLPQERNQP